MALPKDGQQFKNIIKEENIAFGAITSSYATLIDLGSTELYSHFQIQSDLNQEISLRFPLNNRGVQDVITFSDETFTLDLFVHGGVIEIKHNGAAPGSGSLKIRSW